MPQAQVAIITDSTACVPPALAAEHGIDIVPLNLIFAGRTFVDGLTEDTAEFYRLLRISRDRPMTAAPSPGTYLEAILRAAERAPSVLCVTVAAQFSAMYDSAAQAAALARQERPELDVRVLDSRNATMAQGFVVIEAARAAARGADMEAVVARAEELIPRLRVLAVLDTLSYVLRSGRVPRLQRAAAWASSPLRLKPIIEFHLGDYRPVAVVRGRRRALDRLVAIVEGHSRGQGPLHLCVHHASAPQEAEALADRLDRALHPVELYVSEFTQVMGVHTGPGLLGCAFYFEPPPSGAGDL